MTTLEEVQQQVEKAMDGLKLPAVVYADAAIYTDYATAKATALAKLATRFSGENSRRGDEPVAVRFNPEGATEAEQWEVRRRPFGPHEIDLDRTVWYRFTHGGPRLMAAYYFEWDGA